MMTGVRASRSRCTASRVPVNPAPTMAIRGVAVTGARIVHDTCMVRSEAYPFSCRDSRPGVRGDTPATHRYRHLLGGSSGQRADDIPPCADIDIRMESSPLRVPADTTLLPAAGSVFDLLPIDRCHQGWQHILYIVNRVIDNTGRVRDPRCRPK